LSALAPEYSAALGLKPLLVNFLLLRRCKGWNEGPRQSCQKVFLGEGSEVTTRLQLVINLAGISGWERKWRLLRL
jgi:hypothetical protein